GAHMAWVTRVGLLAAAFGLAAAGSVNPAQATLLLDLNTGGNTQTCTVCSGSNGTTYGWSFRVKAPIEVDAIGFFDVGADGIGTSVKVGLWRGTRTSPLLASAIITDSSKQVASVSADGRWLFEKIPVLFLQKGTYEIGGVLKPSLPLYRADA